MFSDLIIRGRLSLFQFNLEIYTKYFTLPWIISVNIGLLSSDAKENIRKEWFKQVHTAKDVVVIDQSIAPFEIIDDLKND